MKARNMWIITGTIGVLGLGTGAAFAATPDTAGDADHGVTLTPVPPGHQRSGPGSHPRRPGPAPARQRHHVAHPGLSNDGG